MTTGRLRAAGTLFVSCGTALAAIGGFLLSGVMSWRISLDGAGLSVVWLLVTGLILILMGADMLIRARRPRGLLWILAGLISVFVVVGVIVALMAGRRWRQIGG